MTTEPPDGSMKDDVNCGPDPYAFRGITIA